MSQRGIAAGFAQCSFISIPTVITNEAPCLTLFYGALLLFPVAIRKLLMWKKKKKEGKCHEKNHGRLSSLWKIPIQNWSGGLLSFLFFFFFLFDVKSQTPEGRGQFSAEHWLCHSFLALLGRIGVAWWVEHHLSWSLILFREWHSAGTKAQHKFDFPCNQKLYSSCVCQDKVGNSSEYRKAEGCYHPKVR